MLPPPFVAVGNHDVAAIRRLLDDGVDPNAWSPLHGQSLLFTASDVEDLTLVRMLLERGADPNQRLAIRSIPTRLPGWDVTVLMYARTADIATALIEFGADVNAQDNSGTTALMNAAFWGRIDVLRVLLDCGADTTMRQNARRKATALHLAEQQLTLWHARLHRTDFPFYRPDFVAERFRGYQEIVWLLRTTSRYLPH
jgi:uncharacterized protein